MSWAGASPEQQDTSAWLELEPGLLGTKNRERYERMKAAIEASASGMTLAEIRRRWSVSGGSLQHLKDRCVELHDDGQVWGWRALRKWVRQKAYTRARAPKPVGPERKGLSGAWMQLVETHEKVRKIIFDALAPALSARRKEAGVNIAGLHRRIIALLVSEGWTEYPLGTENMGYVALTKFINRLLDAPDDDAARAVFGPGCMDALQAMTNRQGLMHARRAFDIVCYDEQQLPFIGTIEIIVNGLPVEVPLHRCHLCVLVDQKREAVLGYSITIDERIRARDLLGAYESAITRWQPLALSIPQLHYLPGAGLPSGVVPEAAGMRIRILKMDNHLVHYARAVRHHLRRRVGCVITFGQVRRWISRHVVEALFAQLQTRGFRRLPSTTGTGPRDPAVEEPVKQAIARKIRWEHLIELIDVLIANHNVTRRKSLMMKSPNEAIALDCAQDARLSVVPRMSQSLRQDPQVAVEVVHRIVRGDRKKGRHPYVEIDGPRYTSDLLGQSWGLVGKRLTLHIKGDFRQVRAFLPKGEEFGPLQVQGHWAREFHTREMRREINRLHRKDVLPRIEQGDDVANYLDFLALQASANKGSRSRAPKISKAANRLAAAKRDAGEPLTHAVGTPPSRDDRSLNLDDPATKTLRAQREFFSKARPGDKE